MPAASTASPSAPNVASKDPTPELITRDGAGITGGVECKLLNDPVGLAIADVNSGRVDGEAAGVGQSRARTGDARRRGNVAARRRHGPFENSAAAVGDVDRPAVHGDGIRVTQQREVAAERLRRRSARRSDRINIYRLIRVDHVLTCAIDRNADGDAAIDRQRRCGRSGRVGRKAKNL